MEAEDGGADNKFYLGKTVTVTGENLASIEGFKVDGVEAALVGEPTDVSAQFIVPEGVTFTEATEVAVKALYNGGNEADFGTAKVYPFYYYKGIRWESVPTHQKPIPSMPRTMRSSIRIWAGWFRPMTGMMRRSIRMRRVETIRQFRVIIN